MTTFNENDLSTLLLENTQLRSVEPEIFSVLPNNDCGNEYDSEFGFMYDLIACNPIYNRLIWGYSVKIFPKVAKEALQSAQKGYVLDLGCGSLAFTWDIYRHHTDRPVLLVDQSLKMLRMAKTRIIKQNGVIPEHLFFLHADALNLPFQDNSFSTIISENLLHCIIDTSILLKKLKRIIQVDGKAYFTTLIINNRLADKYLQVLADKDKLIPRTMRDHINIFNQEGLETKYEATGNIVVIRGTK